MSSEAPARRSLPLRALGALVAVAGLVLSAAPTLVHDPGPTTDLFEATERHVRWGLAVGIGALLVAHPWRRPWSVVLAWIALCLSGGYLVARFIGIGLVQPGSVMQWVWAGVEILICLAAAAWIRHRRAAPDRGTSRLPP